MIWRYAQPVGSMLIGLRQLTDASRAGRLCPHDVAAGKHSAHPTIAPSVRIFTDATVYMQVLGLNGHIPKDRIRDTALHPKLMKWHNGKLRSRSLKDLAASELGVVIQSGEHSALEDARAALYIYQRHQHLWLAI
jgi:hypothetical protein